MASKMSKAATFRKIVTKKLSTAFGDATKIVSVSLPQPEPGQVLIKTKYLGVNATDVNITAGRYFIPDPTPPFDTGLEALGEVVAVGNDVKSVTVGDSVAYFGLGGYAEYLCVPEAEVSKFPELNPDYLAIMISGRTAAIGLEKAGHIKKEDTVLITAAAGGTGAIAVQYAKALGCHVIGTCSSDEKVNFLKGLKCDRPINYRKEKLEDVLKKEYPNGVDVVWETVGGEMFETLVKHLAIRGRLIVVGFITKYKSDAETWSKSSEFGFLPAQLLGKSSTVTGFLLPHFEKDYPQYHKKLLDMYAANQIQVFKDMGDETTEGRFTGLESVARAVEHLHNGKSKGKVLVEMP